MAAAKTAYVEDYNSTISEVVPLSRRHAAKKLSTLDTLREGASDSGYEPSQHSSQLSPIASRTATPANDGSSTAPAAQQSSQEQQQQQQQAQHQQHQQQAQQQAQQQQQQQQRDQQHREYYRHQEREREYQRYYQERDIQQHASTPMQRRVSSHLSAQTSSSSSSNATPSGSRPNSVKAPGSRESSPAVHKHQSSHGGDNAIDGDSSCDCSQCKTKTSLPAAHNGLSTPWNLNYPPFTTAHHTPPYGHNNYANVSPMRSYDYGRTRDRPIPARPLSYGGANPVTTSSSWGAYGYYGQAQAAPQSYGTPSYVPPPINTAIPAATNGTGPYSAMAGGYSGYVYPSPQEYWASTQPTAAVAGSSSSAYEHTMPPPPIPTRRTATRVVSGVQNNSPRNSAGDYHQKYARKYAEEYADNKYSEKYPGGYDRYSRRYTEEYTDKYDDRYADHYQGGAPITRRMSQRTSQGSGAYAHLREEAVPTRSTSVPPSETGPVAPPEERRRTKTPGPPATRMRRDSTSTSGSANASLAGALTRVPKPNEYALYDEEYSRTPPSHHGSHSRHSSRYDRYDRYDDYYAQPVTPRHPYIYRGSDSSGTSSGGAGEDVVVGASDGTCHTLNMPQGAHTNWRYPTTSRWETRSGN